MGATIARMLSDAEVEGFIADGFVAVRAAFPADVAASCCDVVWHELAAQGIDRHDRATWRSPVVRIPCPEGGPFVDAGTATALWDAYDQLIGAGWWGRRRGVGGTIPVRFPSEGDPGDAGWHIDTSFPADGDWWANVRTRDRGLLALFLFTDVTESDAPSCVRVTDGNDYYPTAPDLILGFSRAGDDHGHVAADDLPAHFESVLVAAPGYYDEE